VELVEVSGTEEGISNKLMSLKQTVRRKSSETNGGISECKKCYQPRTNLVNDGNGDMLADSHKILNIWKNYFCQLLNIYGVNNIGQTEIHTAKPLVPEPSPCEVGIVIVKLKGYKSPSIDQISAELIQAAGNTLRSEVHQFINSL
jgi:hypothetical protein